MTSALNDELAALFRRILNTRSMTVIEYCVEDKLAESGVTEAGRTWLSRILEAKTLDAMYAECLEALGEHDEAKKHREWDAGRKAREATRHSPPL